MLTDRGGPPEDPTPTSNGVKAFYLHGHGDNPPILHTPADVDALVDALLAQTWENRVAALYHRDHPVNALGLPDHELEVAVDPDAHTGALRYMGEWQGQGGTWFSQGDSGRTGVVLHFFMGSDNEWPADSAIPLDAVRTAVKEFLTTAGQRPTNINWQPHWSMPEGWDMSDDDSGYGSYLRITLNGQPVSAHGPPPTMATDAGPAADTVLVDGVVRSWDDEGGVGVIDTDRTPGGCLAHFSAVEMDGYRKLRPGQHVRLRIEPAQNQDGYFFRAIHVHPLDQT